MADLDAIERETHDPQCRTCDGEGMLPDPADDDLWGDDCPACAGYGRVNVARHVPALVAEVRRLRAIIRKARPRVVQPHMDGGAHLGFTSCVVTGDELTVVLRAEQEDDRG